MWFLHCTVATGVAAHFAMKLNAVISTAVFRGSSCLSTLAVARRSRLWNCTAHGFAEFRCSRLGFRLHGCFQECERVHARSEVLNTVLVLPLRVKGPTCPEENDSFVPSRCFGPREGNMTNQAHLSLSQTCGVSSVLAFLHESRPNGHRHGSAAFFAGGA